MMSPSDDVLKSSGLVVLNASNYNRWQFDCFEPYLGKSILEIGCGIGNITQYLLKPTNQLQSVDIKKAAVDFTNQRFKDYPNFTAQHIDIFQNDLPGSPVFDTIVFSNVLEHIEDDRAAMKRCHSLLSEKKGRLLLLVPAHRFLYGTCDEEAGHYRRYTKKGILRLATESGFQVEKIYLFNFVGAIGWFINYCLLRRRNTNNQPADAQVGFFDKYLVGPSRKIESWIKPPIGISIIAVMRVK